MKRSLFSFLEAQSIEFTPEDDTNIENEQSEYGKKSIGKALEGGLGKDQIICPFQSISEYLEKDIVPKTNIEVVCNFDLDLADLNPSNYSYKDISNSNRNWVDIASVHCYPHPYQDVFINKALFQSLSHLPAPTTSTALTYMSNHDRTQDVDSVFHLLRRKSEWHEAISSVLALFFSSSIVDKFYILHDILSFNSRDLSTDKLPSACFHKLVIESTNNSKKYVDEYICIVEKVPKKMIKRLQEFLVNIEILSSSKELSEGEIYDWNRALWSSRGIFDEFSRGQTILLRGEYSIRVLIDIYLEIIVSKNKRATFIKLPYIICELEFTHSTRYEPCLRIIKAPLAVDKYDHDYKDSSLRRYELSGFFYANTMTSLVNALLDIACKNKCQNKASYDIPIDAIDVSWASLSSMPLTSQRTVNDVTSFPFPLKSPFELLSRPIDLYANAPIQDDVDRDDILNRDDWLKEAESSADAYRQRYFSLSLYTRSIDSLAMGYGRNILLPDSGENSLFTEIRYIAPKKEDTSETANKFEATINLLRNILPPPVISSFLDDTNNRSTNILVA